jgi:hypothetical protein
LRAFAYCLSHTCIFVPVNDLVKSELAATKVSVDLAAAEQAALLNITLLDIKLDGTPTNVAATGTYSWTDLGITDDLSPLPFLTNSQCAAFNRAVTDQASLALSLQNEIVKVLPVTLASIDFLTETIVCSPLHSWQTQPDQQAVFALNFTLSGAFNLFAAGASYVTLPNGVTITGQLPESTAPLGLKSVRSALQNALRRVFVPLYKAAMSKHCGVVTFCVVLTCVPCVSFCSRSSCLHQ